jgi:hypothetical protein
MMHWANTISSSTTVASLGTHVMGYKLGLTLVLNLIHTSTHVMISVRCLEDSLLLAHVLLLLVWRLMHAMIQLLLMWLAHFLSPKDGLLVRCVHIVLLWKRIFLLSFLLVLMYSLLLGLMLCRIVGATRYMLSAYTWLLCYCTLNLGHVLWIVIVSCHNRSRQGFVRNIIMLALQKTFQLIS